MTTAQWDAIVIGSGIGGLACAAALAHSGRRVAVLEQHSIAGGLTQTFSRGGYTWNVGVHYLGNMGPHDQAAGILHWLADGAIEMAPSGAVYDTLHFPDGFEIALARPEAALRLDLAEKFPGCEREIDAFLVAVREAEQAGRSVFAQRAMPAALGKVAKWWHRKEVQAWWGRTTAEVVGAMISEPKLRAVLTARWGDYGGRPSEGSFGLHAVVMRHYMQGAYYPVGGAKAFADGLVPAIERSGGNVRVDARVVEILVEADSAVGVRLADGETLRAPLVFSDAGARNTAGRLLPERLRASEWAREVLDYRPAPCHLGLYLGLEGDIRAHGASASNHWIYESWDTDAATWRDPFAEASAPGLFVSFPSLKDPRHDPGVTLKHTAELIALTDWDAFSQWASSRLGNRPPEYRAFKEVIENNLVAQFCRRFPALAPMIRYRELSTPLSTAAFTGAAEGAMYGLETTPRRFLSRALGPRTPVRGLFLAGQDVVSPGVAGAMMGGVLAAAAVEPRLFSRVA